MAARNDPALYELLALFDALRAGQARVRELATRFLTERLSVESSQESIDIDTKDLLAIGKDLTVSQKAVELSDGIGLDRLLEDIRTRYAAERALAIVGEAARLVSQETKEVHAEIPWTGIIGFRDR